MGKGGGDGYGGGMRHPLSKRERPQRRRSAGKTSARYVRILKLAENEKKQKGDLQSN